MSDIGIIFPLWFSVGLALLVALPGTTAIMAGLGVAAYRIRRSDRARRLTRLKCSLIVVAPFWLLGLGVGGWTTLSFILKQVAEAQHYFTLDKAVEVDGITLPAGTRVELDDANALRVAELPDDTTLALRGTMWRGRIEFAEPSHASNAAHGQITDGRCADPACLGKSPPTVPRH